MQFKLRGRVYKGDTVYALSDIYQRLRNQSREGASTFPEAIITDDEGKSWARISYNGRVWDDVEWQPHHKPIHNPYAREVK